ncbi:tautomerase [Arcobacter sp. CECT 8983]|uniref:tautomerase family protein n=1 Tax=Arcobacter sp. CECT 8983 TaxID=2044508 RepID=UPI00100C1163|nr:tautomerase family protein [Arcobacter sp. CECT 8983]RXJ91226.1 tautomerase [Arcobacter sp. CECT 8983]
MPHLQFEINQKVSQENKKNFAKEIRTCFSEVMDTGTDHIAISIREYEKYNLTIGRANTEDTICLMNLDIREGRTIEQRRELALRFMDIVNRNFNVENENQYITFTEHKGEDFHLIEKYLGSWERGEDPLA